MNREKMIHLKPYQLEKQSHISTLLKEITVLVISTIFALGCMTVGEKFSEVNVLNIKLGSTKKDEIRSMFGTPWRVGVTDGNKSWTYGIYEYSLIQKNKATDLVIRFDNKGLVSSFKYSTTEHKE